MKFERNTVKKPTVLKPETPAKAPESTPGATITPDVARAALEADLANIRARAAAGKPLTGKQRAILAAVADGMAPGKDVASHCSTIGELAVAIGVDRKTISRWLILPDNPGRKADGRFSVEAWLAYKGTRPAGLGDHPEKRRRIALQNAKLQWEIDQLKRRHVAVSDVVKWNAELCGKIREIVRGTVVKASHAVVGCTAPEAESRLKLIEDELLTRLHTIGSN